VVAFVFSIPKCAAHYEPGFPNYLPEYEINFILFFPWLIASLSGVFT
jgi:hypothetical protein